MKADKNLQAFWRTLASTALLTAPILGCSSVLRASKEELRIRRYAAFDELRVLRRDEPVSIAPTERVAFVEERIGRRVVQAMTLKVRLQSGLSWQDLPDGISLSDDREASLLIVGEATRKKLVEQGTPLAFPRLVESTLRRADHKWTRDSAAGIDIRPIMSSSVPNKYLIAGVEAVAARSGLVTEPTLIQRSWPPDAGLEYPINPSYFAGALIQISGVTAKGIDSVRILGSWYRLPLDSLASEWRVRPLALVVDEEDAEGEERTRRVEMNELTKMLQQDERTLKQRQRDFLVALDSRDAREAELHIICRTLKAERCWPGKGAETTLVFAMSTRQEPGKLLLSTYTFRTLREMRLLSIVIGTSMIFAALYLTAG
jgi:hypothetical protein